MEGNNDFTALAFFICSHIILSIWAIRKVIIDNYNSKRKKYALSALIVLIPFLISLFIIIFLSPVNKKPKSKHRYMEAGYKSYTRWS